MTATTKKLCALEEHPPSEYLFDLQYADCCKLEHPRISDLLEDAAEHHHVHCGCRFRIGRAWAVSLPATDEGLRDFSRDNATHVGLDTQLSAIEWPSDGRLGLVISKESESTTSIDYLRLYRIHRFSIRNHASARVIQRFGWDGLQLPGPHQGHYDEMCRIRGLTFVDKTDFVRAFSERCLSPRLAVLRRPKGFGKTTFLSAVESFFDVLALHAYFPFMNQEHASSPAHHRLLVLRLDFNHLQLREDINLEDAYAECESFLKTAARNFYFTYKNYLEPYASTRRNRYINFPAVTAAAKAQGLGVFLSIDNYTAPTKYRSLAIMEAIGETIFVEMSAAIYGGFIRCGMLVGDTIPHAPPWSNLGHFEGHTNDLSDDPEFYSAIGFTRDEVEALGKACSIPMSSFLKCLCIGTAGGGASSPAVYCAADVLSVARQFVQDRSSNPAPQPAAILPPLPAVVDEIPPRFGPFPEVADSDISDEFTADDLGLGQVNLPDDEEAFWTMVQNERDAIASMGKGSSPKMSKIISPKSSPAKSDASSPRGSASSRSYHSSFMSNESATSSDPPSSPTDERGARH